MTQRPLCSCHGLPMWANGPGAWVCRVRKAERNGRRVRIGIATECVYVATMPTLEATHRLRKLIREEAPRGQA